MPSVEWSKEQRAGTSWHWRSLAELSGGAEYRAFAEAEFPAEADPGRIDRRRWLQLMGASLLLAAAGCETEPEHILPFAKRPERFVPGKRQQYATAFEISGNAIGLLVTCVDGRPIKVEGNPQHPFSLGATNAFAQAVLLELYDPDRSRFPVESAKRGPAGRLRPESSGAWSRFDSMARRHFTELRARQGEGFCVLAEPCSSPTFARLRRKLLELMPRAKWFEYEPLTDDNERAGATLAFGRPYRTHFDLSKADVLLCIEADLLGLHPASLRYARQFAQRRPGRDGTMNRLYCVECAVSITGAAADHRLPLPRSHATWFLAKVLEKVERFANGSEEAGEEKPGGYKERFVQAVAADLWRHRGSCLVAVGPELPPELHAAAHRLNALLGNLGRTVTFTDVPDPERTGHVDAITELAHMMRAGQVETLLIFGGNPAYDAPADLNFAEALRNVPNAIHCSLYRNETSLECRWHVPQAHPFESWSDARAYDGTYSVIQPMISPLHGGRSWIELLARLLGEEVPDARALVFETFRELASTQASNKLWRKTVHDGLLEGSAWATQTPPEPKEIRLEATPADSSGQLELAFCTDYSVYDGRFANNSWLQECPDPITKLTWDNAALISPGTAEKLGLDGESLIELSVAGRSLTVPVFITPGQAADTIALSVGYGRTAAGLVGGMAAAGIEPVGVNAYTLRTAASLHYTAATVRPTGRRYRLASTQDHFAIDPVGRQARQHRAGLLVREADLEHYKEQPDFAKHMVHVPQLESLWQEHAYEGHRWGMAIDLSKCIGCNACVLACQAENNVPVVGKEQVLRGREMHWLRIDRYFRGDPDAGDIQIAMQPVACHHCELAPCEQVCPVAATVHSKEGLNEMVYNRCVGTRYCANNCPYKVRRFNYFNYHKELKDPDRSLLEMVFNPEVTVRSRGVMEKCTYCVQRIQAAKIAAANEGRPVRDGQVQAACQQVCPTVAIVFGDLADPHSAVAAAHADPRSYFMLAELNVKPRTAYLAKIRNLNPDLQMGNERSHRTT